MATIDDKIVSMSFESSKFEQGVNKAISSLDKLKSSLKLENVGKGIEQIGNAFSRFNLGRVGESIDEVKNKLGALHFAFLSIFADIAKRAVYAGTQFAKSFTIQPLISGFQEYATNLNSIQTILANTQASGAGLKDVNAALDELNDFSDKTIYNFSQMAKNIGTFTAAGVDLETATGSIKGIANLAALSGSSADQASNAMYQLSQAISAGRVSLQDWNSVVNAGMGGTVFQRALAQTAAAVGTLDEKAVKLTGKMKNVSIAGKSFRESIQAGPGKTSWLTSEVLTKTLQQFTGDLSKAELKAQGFNDAQIKAIQQTAKTAFHAATEVKTLSQVLDVAKETAGSGWAQTWRIIFGDFAEAKTTFTALSNTINGFINANADARNKVLGDWKALGGRTVLIDSIKTAFQNLGEILKPIKEAFRDIFPPVTGKQLFALTKNFREFAKALKPSAETVDNLKRTFKGFFALLDIGAQIVKGFWTFTSRIFESTGAGEGKFLSFTAKIGDFLVALDKTLKSGNKVTAFFNKLADVLQAPMKILVLLAKALAGLFSGFSSGGISESIDGVTESLSPFERMVNAVSKAWNSFMKGLEDSQDIFQSIGEAIGTGLANFGTALGDVIGNMNFEAIFAAIRTGLFAGLVLMFKKFLGKGSFADQVGGGILKNITGSFAALEGSLKAFQTNIKADTLKKIAIAVGILTASIVALSFIKPEKLKASLAAIAVAFGELLGAMAILDKVSSSAGFLKMPFITASMIAFATAVDILAIAVIGLSQLSWEELAKGLGGVAALLGGISAAVIPLSANSGGMIRAGVGITAIAIALNLLALAVKQMAGLDLKAMGKGLGGVAVGLGALIAGMRVMPKGIATSSAALIAVAIALNLLAGAVEKFGGMDMRTIGKGVIGIAGGLAGIAVAMRLMPKNMALTAAGLLIVAFALGKIVEAVVVMGGMSIKTIAKGIIALGAALGVLAIALYAMSGTLAGAAALGIAAAGISLIVPALQALGKMSWGTIIKGLIALGAAFTVIGIAGAVLTASVPGLIGFGVALTLIGAGVALIGAGLFLISAAFSALVVAFPTGAGIMLAAMNEFQEGMVDFVKNFILGLLEIVEAFSVVAPKFAAALVPILESLIDVVIQVAPKIGEAFVAILDTVLMVIQNNQDKLIQAGFNLILALLNGLENNIGAVVAAVVRVLDSFVNAIIANMNKIIDMGAKLILAFIKGILGKISVIVSTIVTIIGKIISTIAANLGKIATAGLSVLTKFIGAIVGRIGDVVKMGAQLVTKLVEGIGNAASSIVRSAVTAASKFINTLATESLKLVNTGFNALINFLNGLAKAIEEKEPQVIAAGARVGKAIVKGLIKGIGDMAGELYGKIKGVMDKAMSLVKKIPIIGSPSKVTTEIGEFIVLGLVKGIDDTAPELYNSAENVSNGLVDQFKDTLQIRSPSKVMHEIGQAVGEGFANGLKGSGEDITNAFKDLDAKLQDAMQKARETIASEEDKLAKLRAAKKPDAEAIKKAQETIKENEELLKRSTAGHILLTKTLKEEKTTLIGLANDYKIVSDKLAEARDALKQAREDRASEIQSFADAYSALPEISEKLSTEIAAANQKIAESQANLNTVMSESANDVQKVASARQQLTDAQTELQTLLQGKILDPTGTQVDLVKTYLENLREQSTAVVEYRQTLEQLRKLGLDDETYRKLVEEGTADQQFATELLKAGPTAIKALNEADKTLNRESLKLATSAGNSLHAAGVKAAEGLVNGLLEKQSDLNRAIRKLARGMLAALKDELGIKSPSQAFMEIGALSMEGMALGFKNSSDVLVAAVDDAAKDALTGMRDTMRHISNEVASELNPNPVITPVLDLTTVRTQAAELSSLAGGAISASTSLGHASVISSEHAASQTESTAATPVGASVVFEQNNYSPEALTEIQIYRQTKNQLSQLKSALAIT